MDPPSSETNCRGVAAACQLVCCLALALGAACTKGGDLKTVDTIIRCPLSSGDVLEFEIRYKDHKTAMSELFYDAGWSIIAPEVVRKDGGMVIIRAGDAWESLPDDARIALCRKISTAKGSLGPAFKSQVR